MSCNVKFKSNLPAALLFIKLEIVTLYLNMYKLRN